MIKNKTAFYVRDVLGISVGFFDLDNFVRMMWRHDYFSFLNNCICTIKILTNVLIISID